jgi:uncharacterized protein (DUF697 family)
MHHIDRTMTEYEPEYEFETLQADEFEFDEFEYGDTEVLNEADEMDLASELLSVSDEAELDQFLGKLIRKVGKTVKKAVAAPLGKQVGGLLKGAVKKVLPVATGAIGTFLGGPVGAAVSGQLGSLAGNALGLELEGLSPEDQEFEVARRLVRFSGDAVKRALQTSAPGNPAAIARQAVIEAARRHAPGLVSANNGGANEYEFEAERRDSSGSGYSGRWIRRGQKIILIGV